jgi:transcriptional regulator with XRE-family HTH domain
LKLPRLREVRELRGWSQGALAEKAGVSRDSISNYETGQREAYPSTAKKLADALDVTTVELEEPIDWRVRVLELQANHLEQLIDVAELARKTLERGEAQHTARALDLLLEGLHEEVKDVHEAVRIERGEKKTEKSVGDRLNDLLQEIPDLQASAS